MKTIKLFLASSDELQDDRNAIGNLVRRLDKIYEKRGIRVELFEWEDCDAAYNGVRKQDEYNEAIKASDMFLALFHKKAGKYTLEEFDVATEEFRRHASPKVYMYCKDLDAGDIESPELTEFKDRLFKELGHYWCRYGNRDSLQLHLVMQLQLVENTKAVDLTMEDGTVTLDGMAVAKMDNLPFAAGNEEYRKMREELLALPEKIDKARSRVEKFPDDDDLREDLQQKLNRYNNLKEEFGAFQKSLFDTARQITEIQQHQVNDLLRRAIDAFEGGDLKKANVLLEEIAHEAERHVEQMDRDRALVHQDIDALRLQAKTVLADRGVPAENRIAHAKEIYEKADDWAKKSAYPEERLMDFLSEYGDFLGRYAFFDEALAVYLREWELDMKLLGENHPETAWTCNCIGLVCSNLEDYPQALEYYSKALEQFESILGEDHPTTLLVTKNIASTYVSQGDYRNGIAYFFDVLHTQEEVLGEDAPSTAATYHSIGVAATHIGEYDSALDYLSKALDIWLKVYGENDMRTAMSYHSIGYVYTEKGDYRQALEYYFKALEIKEDLFGRYHPSTAVSYNNIGHLYATSGDTATALKYYEVAMEVYEKVLGEDRTETARVYNNIGQAYADLGDYGQALEYCCKARSVYEKVSGESNPGLADANNNIGFVYAEQGDYEQAVRYYFKALEINKSLFGDVHPSIALSYNNIGCAYGSQGDYPQALEYFFKGVKVYEEMYGENHPELAANYSNIASLYVDQGDNASALEFSMKALHVRESTIGGDHPDTLSNYFDVADLCYDSGRYKEASDYYTKARDVLIKAMGDDQPGIKDLDDLIEKCDRRASMNS